MYAFAQPKTLESEDLIPDEVTKNSQEKENYSVPLKTIVGVSSKYIKTPSCEPKLYEGLRLTGLGNDTIYAFADGIVSISQKNNKHGNHIVLKHENELESLYAHNSRNFVKAGDSVKSGEPIGITGNKGKLHFEILKNGESVNPREYLEELITDKKGAYYFKEERQ